MATYYSNGKLFLLGEYYVLLGAKVLALPTRFGQYLDVYPLSGNKISWKSYDVDHSVWFNEELSTEEIILNHFCPSDHKIKNTLREILHHACLMNPDILTSNRGYYVETRLTFPRNWGLGTSSTLINNIAQWFEIDAFELLERSFGGSGYDIASAQNDRAVLYQKKEDQIVVKPFNFNPEYTHNIYFLYLNQKRNSKEAIVHFRQKQQDIQHLVLETSDYSEEIIKGVDYERFKSIMLAYELQLGKILETPPVQFQLFSDFEGVVKSMGAWGGDFVMVLSEYNPSEYFSKKGYDVLLTYDEMILEK